MKIGLNKSSTKAIYSFHVLSGKVIRFHLRSSFTLPGTKSNEINFNFTVQTKEPNFFNIDADKTDKNRVDQ